MYLKPTSALCVSLSDLERIQGHPEKAKEVLLYGLKHCRAERSKLFMALAWLEEDMFFNRDEAVKLINQAIKIDPKNVRIYIAKASMELRRGDISGARQTLESSCKLPSEDGQHYTMLGLNVVPLSYITACHSSCRRFTKLD